MGAAKSKLIGNFGEIIQTFKCKYVGSVPVTTSSGEETANKAMSRILSLKQPEIQVVTIVTDSGVFVTDKDGNVVRQTTLETVSFVQQHSTKAYFVVYFENDKNNKLIICHMFRFPGDAVAFPLAVYSAFEVQKEAKADDDEDNVDSSLKFIDGEADEDEDKPSTMRSKSNTSTKGVSMSKNKKRSMKEMRRDAQSISSGKDNAIVPEVLKREIKGKYMGQTPVGADTEEVTRLAITTILKDVENETCLLCIYSNAIVLSREHGGFDQADIHSNSVRECVFGLYDDTRDLFCYIIRNMATDTLTAYLVGVPKIPASEMSHRRLIHNCIKEQDQIAKQMTIKHQSLQRHNSSEQVEDAKDLRHNYEAIFRGTVVAPNTVDPKAVVEKAVEVVGEDDREELTFLQCYKEGVRVFDAMTSEVRDVIVTSEVMGIQNLGRHFILVRNDAKVGELRVYIFKMVNKERAEQVRASCSKFFDESMKSQARSPSMKVKEEKARIDEDNPFAGEGQRIAAPGNLFRRQIRRANLTATKVIGAGQFGQVYLADMREKDGLKPCAVKTLKDVKSEADRKEFVHEAEVMLETNHPNLLGLTGVAVQQRPWLMVLDIMEYGDLQGVLKAAPKKGITLSTKELLLITKECCAGMKYMEEIGFVHCDLAARNILVGEENQFKVADFGMTRRLRTRNYWNGPKAMRVPIKWSAVEILQERKFSIKSDIWAFGVLIWEIFTYGETPYPGLMNADVHRLLLAGGRMKSPGNCPKPIYDVVKTCWKEHPETRPMFKELLSEFELHFRNSKHKPPRDIGACIKQTNTSNPTEPKRERKKGEFVYDASNHSMVMLDKKPANKRRNSLNTILNDDDDDDELSTLEEDVDL